MPSECDLAEARTECRAATWERRDSKLLSLRRTVTDLRAAGSLRPGLEKLETRSTFMVDKCEMVSSSNDK